MTVSAETWLPLGPLEDMEDGERREVTLPTGKIILLIRAEGKIHAVCADCPHQDTPLAEGSVDGTILTCPLHFWQWDIRTGEEIGLAELPLKIFELRLDNVELFVRSLKILPLSIMGANEQVNLNEFIGACVLAE